MKYILSILVGFIFLSGCRPKNEKSKKSTSPNIVFILAELYPEKTSELKALLQNWQKEVNAEFPVPNPEFEETRRYEWGVHPDRRQ